MRDSCFTDLLTFGNWLQKMAYFTHSFKHLNELKIKNVHKPYESTICMTKFIDSKQQLNFIKKRLK